jgi:dsRNA-specific ribonuclease
MTGISSPEFLLGEELIAEGEGVSKQEAQRAAAKQALHK